MSNKIAKNTAYMTVASVLQKATAFLYFTLIARFIGAEGTGKYFFALSFTTVFVIFVDLGLTNVLIREAAKLKDKIQTYFSTILSVKMVLGVLAYIAAIITVNLMGYPESTRHLVYLSGVTMLFDSFHLSIYGVLRAIGDLKWEAISNVGSQVLTLIMGSIFLYFDFPLIFLILAFTIPSALNALFGSSILYFKYNISPKPEFYKNTFYTLGKIAIPFALAAVFARIYSYADTIILSKLASEKAVGWYSIPYKIANSFQFLPLALVAAIYPKFSEYYDNNKDKLADLFEKSMKYMFLLVFPIAIGIFVLGKDIILTIYTEEYINSVLPLKILMGSLVFTFISFPIGSFLNACDKQKTQTTIVGIVMVINIALNFMLIPEYRVVGASIAALVGNFLLATAGYLFVPKITEISHKSVFLSKFKILLSALVMGGVVWYVNSFFHFAFAIAAGVVFYPIMLFFTRAVTTSQVKEMIRIVKK